MALMQQKCYCGVTFFGIREYVALEFGVHFSMVRCAPDTLCGDKECPENPVCSLVWSGTVVGAPGADNLKIRPEFFPGGVASIELLISALKNTPSLVNLL
ncbi:hypothetical protein [Photobacterium halotolerans]|uniref:Uncharacterized protein n=1 Tax=Photobacterium halotolerans TaxID=265726 RepID=A0A0F5VAH6_9GAMM|nr:hypothetical protein [Photobacterium halotolerans]KKC99077.1 hypothetical protein KY46_14635 [Photobacterium halotolerans]